MGSRYALRELECAIGYDCRGLEDGRRAEFRHTGIHRRAKRNLLERRDAIAVYGFTTCAMAAASSHQRINLSKAIDTIESARCNIVSTAFPYLSGKEAPVRVRQQTMDEMFDELDEIIAKEKSQKEANGGGEPSSPEVESHDGKLV